MPHAGMTPETPTPGRFFEPYDRDACEECGRCLMNCPVMGLDEAGARAEMRAMRGGGAGKHVLRRCESCFACNLVCPNQANPAQLFIERFRGEYRSRGMPRRALHFQPHEEENFRTYVIRRLPADEKRTLKRWADTSPCEEFAYPGCNMCTSPYLAGAGFLKDLNIRGAPEYCCGEMYYRTGMFDRLEESAARLNLFLEKLRAKRMMVLCNAGYNMFTNVLPRFGLKAEVQVTSFLPWLWERIEGGEIRIERRLGMSATIQDSCYGKVLGEAYYSLPRKILERLGVEVREMAHAKECSYCCGIGGGFPPGRMYHPYWIGRATVRSVMEARRTGADAVVTYCAGCLQTLCSGMALLPALRKPAYHVFQLVQMAAGEAPVNRNLSRGAMFVRGVLVRQTPMMLRGGSVKGRPITKTP
ncbi:MAG: (Fe-S)-binding protein [bacterium]